MLAIFLFSFSLSSPFSWLAGTWKGNTTEVWQLHNDGSLSGISFIEKGKEKNISETIQLAMRDSVWYYTPTVIGQNSNKPVDFKIVEMSDKHFVAENLTHDFPQRIVYRLESEKELVAFIEGPSPKTGEWKKIEFRFSRD